MWLVAKPLEKRFFGNRNKCRWSQLIKHQLWRSALNISLIWETNSCSNLHTSTIFNSSHDAWLNEIATLIFTLQKHNYHLLCLWLTVIELGEWIKEAIEMEKGGGMWAWGRALSHDYLTHHLVIHSSRIMYDRRQLMLSTSFIATTVIFLVDLTLNFCFLIKLQVGLQPCAYSE